MSLKGVEMQIAIPRTNEAANVQHHLNQKPVYDQAALAGQQAKLSESEKNKSAKVDETSHLNVREDGRGNTAEGRGANGRKKYGTKRSVPHEEETAHPYKGKHIDISL